MTEQERNMAIKFGRWLLKYAATESTYTGDCWSYECEFYNTDELFDIFVETYL